MRSQLTRLGVFVLVLAAPCVVCSTAPLARADDDANDAKKDDSEKKVQTVDFRKLKELMPAELAGIKRSKSEGQKIAAGGVSISTASATYEKPAKDNPDPNKEEDNNPPQVRVEVMDYGDKNAAAGAAAVWAENEIDQETDNGYTKTTKIGKHAALESFEKDSKTGTLQVYVAKRFLLTVTTKNLSPEEFQKVAKALPLDKLAALK